MPQAPGARLAGGDVVERMIRDEGFGEKLTSEHVKVVTDRHDLRLVV